MVGGFLSPAEKSGMIRVMGNLVLIAEDEPYIVESISFLLEQDGFEVAIAPRGKEVLGQVDRQRPDVLILDVMLPEIDGYQILKQLRQNQSTASLPVLMLTAQGAEGRPRNRNGARGRQIHDQAFRQCGYCRGGSRVGRTRERGVRWITAPPCMTGNRFKRAAARTATGRLRC